MIHESHVWKDELKKERSKFIRQVLNGTTQMDSNKDEKVYLKIEKFFFVTAFIIRKLNESRKLSDELKTFDIPVEALLRINKEKELTFWNNHRLEEFYDLNQPQKTVLNISILCNYLIHSFIFHVLFDFEEGKLFGVAFNSDYSKDKALYLLTVDNYLLLIEEVIKDEILVIQTYPDGKETRSRVRTSF